MSKEFAMPMFGKAERVLHRWIAKPSPVQPLYWQEGTLEWTLHVMWARIFLEQIVKLATKATLRYPFVYCTRSNEYQFLRSRELNMDGTSLTIEEHNPCIILSNCHEHNKRRVLRLITRRDDDLCDLATPCAGISDFAAQFRIENSESAILMPSRKDRNSWLIDLGMNVCFGWIDQFSGTQSAVLVVCLLHRRSSKWLSLCIIDRAFSSAMCLSYHPLNCHFRFLTTPADSSKDFWTKGASRKIRKARELPISAVECHISNKRGRDTPSDAWKAISAKDAWLGKVEYSA